MHWARKCRCSGVGSDDLGVWCGKQAEEEDGLCLLCRSECIPQDAEVLTMQQARDRDLIDATEGASE